MKKRKFEPDWFFPLQTAVLGAWIVGLFMTAKFPLCLVSLVGIAFTITGGYLMHWELSHWSWEHKKLRAYQDKLLRKEMD